MNYVDMKFLVVVKPFDGCSQPDSKARFENVIRFMRLNPHDQVLVLASKGVVERGDPEVFVGLLSEGGKSFLPVECHDVMGADFNPSGSTGEIFRRIQMRRNKATAIVMMPESQIADNFSESFYDSELGCAKLYSTDLKPGNIAVFNCHLKHFNLLPQPK